MTQTQLPTIVLPPSIKIGASVGIEAQTRDGAKEYKSRIEDIENGIMLITLPSERGEFVPIPAGQFLTLSVATSASNLFVEGEVMGRRTQPFPVLLIRPVGVESNQQRNFHRVQIRIEPLGVWRWIGNGAPPPSARLPRASAADPNWQAVAATIVDLSGGGFGMVSDVQIPREAWVGARFPLPVTNDPFETHGKVMMSRPRPSEGKEQWILGVKFEGLAKGDQERVVKANTMYQLEERRRARGL